MGEGKGRGRDKEGRGGRDRRRKGMERDGEGWRGWGGEGRGREGKGGEGRGRERKGGEGGREGKGEGRGREGKGGEGRGREGKGGEGGTSGEVASRPGRSPIQIGDLQFGILPCQKSQKTKEKNKKKTEKKQKKSKKKAKGMGLKEGHSPGNGHPLSRLGASRLEAGGRSNRRACPENLFAHPSIHKKADTGVGIHTKLKLMFPVRCLRILHVWQAHEMECVICFVALV